MKAQNKTKLTDKNI